jgi:acetylornithine/LysW-gamma-L-lysine aminotransferase
VRAIAEQSATLLSCPEIFYNDRRADLLQRLVAVAPPGMGRAFLCNSGTEAVEAALKFTRACTGRPGIVAAMRGFHGRTMGALSATWTPAYRTPFEPLVPGFHHVLYKRPGGHGPAIGPETGGVLLEVVQGEGGVHPANPEYLSGVQALAARAPSDPRRGADRIWPTGTLFACQR